MVTLSLLQDRGAERLFRRLGHGRTDTRVLVPLEQERRVAGILVPDPEVDGRHVPYPDPVETPADLREPFRLRLPRLDAIRTAAFTGDFEGIAALPAKALPDKIAELYARTSSRTAAHSISRAGGCGIVQRPNLFDIAAWDLPSRYDAFETRDASGSLRDILRASLPETEVMRRLVERLTQL